LKSRYRIHQIFDPSRLYKPPIVLHWSCQFATSCLNCARKGSNSDFEKSDVAAHHAEMGTLLSLNPKTHRLRADTKKHGRFAKAQRVSACLDGASFAFIRRLDGWGRQLFHRFHQVSLMTKGILRAGSGRC
jgi:hypothetical protein